ncbi:hypothetical protein [Microbulbifer taiwanensis]|uniref:Uncharacterized protein n=1 Tax=Microbulbifer taiwanensis TaxID=986746 RepID=A0ABW1YJ86_9GAMM
MYGLMMQSQLTLTGIMRHAQDNFSAREIVSITADHFVISAQAGIQFGGTWVPACAGMTRGFEKITGEKPCTA